jgi:hypothetical protein
MKLIDCTTLVNIEGTVYKLSKKDYRIFKEMIFNHTVASSEPFTWSDILHWVEDHGTEICKVESYNF